jgi:hypothetical protein
MAQDPEPEEGSPETAEIDPSHDLDMVSIYQSNTIDAEVEADVIKGILDTNGIPAMVVRATLYLPPELEVRVPAARVEEARRVIAEARAAGPEAAAEAEAASEEPEPLT